MGSSQKTQKFSTIFNNLALSLSKNTEMDIENSLNESHLYNLSLSSSANNNSKTRYSNFHKCLLSFVFIKNRLLLPVK